MLYFYSPRWSPDGKRIAFRSFSWLEYNEGKESEQIWVVDVKSLDPKPITEKIIGNIRGLSWSTDGKNIIFSKLDEDRSKICIVSSEGGEIQYLNIEGISPDYSPDGSKIAYVRDLKP